MKKVICLLQGCIAGALIILLLATVFLACSYHSNGDDVLPNMTITRIAELQQRGDVHKACLDYLAYRLVSVQETTPDQLRQTYDEWLLAQYGAPKADELRTASAYDRERAEVYICKLAHNGKSELKGMAASCPLSKRAVQTCLRGIVNILSEYEDEQIYDNETVLQRIKASISANYQYFFSLCSDDPSRNQMLYTLGTLYGSVEYWLCRDHVYQWFSLTHDADEEMITQYRASELTILLAGADGYTAALCSPVMASVASAGIMIEMRSGE